MKDGLVPNSATCALRLRCRLAGSPCEAMCSKKKCCKKYKRGKDHCKSCPKKD